MSAITPPILDFQSLASSDEAIRILVSEAVGKAYGPDGPGLLLISGLKDTFAEDRAHLFTGARALAYLGPEKLKALEFPDLDYSAGWSRGRESFKGVVDTHKGSFYANPIYDDPSLGDKDLRESYPHNMHFNRWPTETSCSSIEHCFKSIGVYINEIGLLIGKHCDDYIRRHLEKGAHFQSIEETLRSSRAAKGRLLHYYPMASEVEGDTTSAMWCGYHNDHGTLTGLVSGAYFAEDGGELPSDMLDTSAGLYVARGSRAAPEKVTIPRDCLAFQIGESAQIASGGVLKATPHAVKPSLGCRRTSRVTLAVFLQPNPWDALRTPMGTIASQETILGTNKLVPPLSERYHKDDCFSDFAARTIKAYSR